MPLFESETPEVILKRILGRMGGGLQTREGSYAYDQAAPMAMELWRVLMTLDELVDAFYVNENSGPYLDAHAKLFAMARREGAKAAAKVTFYGQDGVTVPAGTVFCAPGADFALEEDAVLREGRAEGLLRAAETGGRFNVGAGAIDQMLRTIPGLERFEYQLFQGFYCVFKPSVFRAGLSSCIYRRPASGEICSSRPHRRIRGGERTG